jgi:N6-L-threonylcarbamoyladenine synthase
MNILGIETSCDETSVAVVIDGRKVLSNIIYSQTVHEKYGGVVPELAGREHIRRIIPILDQALGEAGLTVDEIDGYAATFGPGLVGALLVGLSLGKSLAYCNDKPFYAVNHLEGHIVANLLAYPDLDDKFLTLLVSGGHTMLIDVDGIGNYTILGKTLDDAAGEAFDKVGKLLGLGYPGGVAVDRLSREGDAEYFQFPRALADESRLDFSYSGLKTAVALHIQKLPEGELSQKQADIAASFQEAAVDMLCQKSILALKRTGRDVLAISGGVAANSRLREKLENACRKLDIRLVYPPLQLCTDNAAMIAGAGHIHISRGDRSPFNANAVPYQKLG